MHLFRRGSSSAACVPHCDHPRGQRVDASRDTDNVLKAILDALVHAQRIPDDTTQYIHALNLLYCPSEAGRTSRSTRSWG